MDPDVFLLLQRNYVPRATVMVRKECLTTVGLFDEENSGNDDWDMWVRFSEKWQLVRIPQPLVEYRIHDRNLSQTRPKKYNFYRLTRLRMLERASERRRRPLWLRFMVWRAGAEWFLGKTPVIGERIPRVWFGLHKVLAFGERWVIQRFLL